MSSPSRFAPAVLVIALGAVLVVLAVLQYRWSGEVSEAASVRMQSSLQAAILGMRQDFTRELAGIGMAVQSDLGAQEPERWKRYAEQIEAWKRTAQHPGLVSNIYLWHDGSNPRFMQFIGSRGEPQASPWPQELERVRGWIQQISLERSRFVMRERGPREPEGRPERRRLAPPCMIAEEVPALVCPIVSRPAKGAPAPSVDWVIMTLDPAILRDHIFGELAERYFGGSDGLRYRVAVVSNSPEERRVIYTSDSDFDLEHVQNADASVSMFGPPGGPGGGFRTGMLMTQPRSDAGVPRGETRMEMLHAAMPHLELMRSAGPRDWQLVVQHRNGSLESVVAGMRRRNLAISFGVLLVLAGTMAVMVISSHRAQRLAQLQMNFVAGVSHELRTPLAVISSAADNIADGVVSNPQQMARYGKVIKTQARQLITLVEQVLLFAATRERRNHQHVRPLAVDELLDTALDATAGLVQDAGITVEKQVEPGLPPVMGDLGALSQCLQNLITNAVKYGGEKRWIGVRAQRHESGEIQISVEDHGPGIGPDELPQIFEPFYRCASATAAQIHGTGLGLPLARSIAEAMGGGLTVASELGHGSCFTLHLPAAVAEQSAAAAKG